MIVEFLSSNCFKNDLRDLSRSVILLPSALDPHTQLLGAVHETPSRSVAVIHDQLQTKAEQEDCGLSICCQADLYMARENEEHGSNSLIAQEPCIFNVGGEGRKGPM